MANEMDIDVAKELGHLKGVAEGLVRLIDAHGRTMETQGTDIATINSRCAERHSPSVKPTNGAATTVAILQAQAAASKRAWQTAREVVMFLVALIALLTAVLK